MSTPLYHGAAQPSPARSDGVLGRLASYFGGSGTPPYAGSGQPLPAQGGLLRPNTPIYASAPVRTVVASGAVASDIEPMETSESVSACPIDPAALAAGAIAIVIPRDRLLP